MDSSNLVTTKHSLSDLPPDLQYAVKAMVDVMTEQVVKPAIQQAEERFQRKVDQSTEWHQSQFKSADTHLDHSLAQMKEAKKKLDETANKVNDSMMGAQSRLGSLEAGHSSQEREISRMNQIIDMYGGRLNALEHGQGLLERSYKGLRDDIYGNADIPGVKSVMSRFDDLEKLVQERFDDVSGKVKEHDQYISNRKRMEAVLFHGWIQIWNNKVIILWVLTILALLIFSLFGVKWLQP